MIHLIRIEREPKHEITFLPFPDLIITLQEATFGFEAPQKRLHGQIAELVSPLGEAREATVHLGPALI